MNIDDADIPRQGGAQQRKLRIVSAILWGLVFSSLVALQLNGTGAMEIIDFLRLGGSTLGIAIVVLGVGAMLVKILQYVGLTTKYIVRLLYLIGFLAGISIVSTFVL